MAASFTVEVDDREVRNALERLSELLGDLSTPMADIARALGNLSEDSFEGERDPWGRPWAALTDDYVARPRRKGGRGGDAHPILQLDGLLAGSLSWDSDRSAAWVGAGKKYAAIHQFGGLPGMAPGPRAIPARPYLPVTQSGEVAPRRGGGDHRHPHRLPRQRLTGYCASVARRL